MHYSEAAVERAMNIQEVRLRAIAKKLTWWQAAEILGLSCRQMRRWKRRYEEHGYNGLFDHRVGLGFPLSSPDRTITWFACGTHIIPTIFSFMSGWIN